MRAAIVKGLYSLHLIEIIHACHYPQVQACHSRKYRHVIPASTDMSLPASTNMSFPRRRESIYPFKPNKDLPSIAYQTLFFAYELGDDIWIVSRIRGNGKYFYIKERGEGL